MVQAMLTGEPGIVEVAASLLKAIVTRNPKAMIRLYSTGAFYFALAYPGSNLLSIAQLFSATHTHQAFHGGEEAAVSSSLPLAKRSVLGGLLPESLLYVLERSGPSAFAAAMVSDSDTPEIIWTHKMRAENLIRQVLQHLGDFPQKLAQHCHSLYDYAPMPPVTYPNLKDEMWCHRYYLLTVDKDDSNFLSSDRAPLLIAASELIWLTCASSSLNGEELIRDGGIPLLATLLSRCMCIVQPTTPANEPSARIVTNIMHTFSVLSQFESGRVEILKFGGLVEDIVHCTELEFVPSAVDAALQTAANVSVSSELQNALLAAGFLWYVLPLLLQYDSTAEENETSETHGVGARVQIAKNIHAVRATYALSRLCGFSCEGMPSPSNQAAYNALKALLTPKLANMLRNHPPKELLSNLNSNLESPEIIWNSSTRGELLNFVDEQRASPGPDGSYDLTESQSFTYKALSKELNVGNVYLRVYNNQPDFEISDQEEFCIALLNFVAELVQKWNSIHLKETMTDQHSSVVDTSTFEKVSDSTSEESSDKDGALSVLYSLASTPELAWAAAKHGGVVYILELMLPLQEEIPMQQRAAAASLLGKLVGQPMHGPRTTETPELVWTPAMAASLSAQLSTMASDLYHEQMKGRVVDWDVPEQASGQHVMKDEPQQNAVDPELPLLLSAALVSLLRVHPALADHVGYLGYVPKLVAAMAYEGRRDSMASGQTTSGSQEEPSEHDKSDGHSETTVQSPQERVRLSCLRVLLHQLASSTTCAEAMAATSAGTPQVVPLLMKAIGWQGGGILALETLKRVVGAGNRARDALVAQGLKVGLVEVLLGILDWRAGGRQGLCSQMKWNESEASIGRVLAVEVLHAFATEGSHCAKVREVLNSSDVSNSPVNYNALNITVMVWSAYKDQKHDLFLPSSAQSSAAGVAGLIESSSSRLTYALTAPPPQPALVRLPSSAPSPPSAPANPSGRHSYQHS
ncbi:hypothetical protein PR202_ga07940 [Eleusine coracana subsp. coracana]|uniref:Uncharacterized protein n=1 Tax=Eleusine coracana subsp. coracana TaxID=191504 RepID=A0AAV5BYV6_ELECO|nr:hypothetical protein PR202_ga07940 [Eleusine coracana subsp. coracana]